MTIMVDPNHRFSVGMALAGLAQFREEEIRKPQVGGSIPLASSWITVNHPSVLHLLSNRIGAIPWGFML